jgi:hypothetical protein
MGFDLCNHALKIWESIWNSNSHNGSSFGSVRVHSLTLVAFPGACDVIPKPPFWPTTLHPLALLAKPSEGCDMMKGRLMNFFHFINANKCFDLHCFKYLNQFASQKMKTTFWQNNLLFWFSFLLNNTFEKCWKM